MSFDVKILTGLIEPHFFAGFSGGPKSVLPGLAGEVSILQNHNSKMINNKNSTWGITFGNPIWEDIKEVARKTEPNFLLNVTINKNKEITGIFAGNIWKVRKNWRYSKFSFIFFGIIQLYRKSNNIIKYRSPFSTKYIYGLR